MLATLDWSHDLLSPQERELLAQLAAFRGSFDLSQVEAICDVEGLDELLGPVMALVDKSLLTRDPATGRYRLLEPVRRYAWDKLVGTGQNDALARRHAAYFAAMVEGAAGGAEADQSTRLDRLEQEHDNLRAALRWSLEAGEGDLALRIGSEAWDFWKLRGHVTKGRTWLHRAPEASQDPPPPGRARALPAPADLPHAPARPWCGRWGLPSDSATTRGPPPPSPGWRACPIAGATWGRRRGFWRMRWHGPDGAATRCGWVTSWRASPCCRRTRVGRPRPRRT